MKKPRPRFSLKALLKRSSKDLEHSEHCLEGMGCPTDRQVLKLRGIKGILRKRKANRRRRTR